MQEDSYLLGRAAHCRRLAASILDEPVVRRLRQLADHFDHLAVLRGAQRFEAVKSRAFLRA